MKRKGAKKFLSEVSTYQNAFQGKLTKRGGRVKTWKQRWFVLDDGLMSYYKSQKEFLLHDEKPLGQFAVRDMVCSEIKTQFEHSFQVITTNRTYYLVAESNEELLKWKQQILHQGGKWGVHSLSEVPNKHYSMIPDIEELYIKEVSISTNHTEEQSKLLTESTLIGEIKFFLEIWKVAVRQQNIMFLETYDRNFPFHMSSTLTQDVATKGLTPAPLDFYFAVSNSLCNVIEEYRLVPEVSIKRSTERDLVKIIGTVSWCMSSTRVIFTLVRVANSSSKIAWIYLNNKE